MPSMSKTIEEFQAWLQEKNLTDVLTSIQQHNWSLDDLLGLPKEDLKELYGPPGIFVYNHLHPQPQGMFLFSNEVGLSSGVGTSESISSSNSSQKHRILSAEDPILLQSCLESLLAAAMVPISDSVRNLLLTNQAFLLKLKIGAPWTKERAKNLIMQAKMYLKTSTKMLVENEHGYHFGPLLSSRCGAENTIIKAWRDGDIPVCAKVGRLKQMKKENEVGNIIQGPCIMPIQGFLEVKDDRAVLISPLYNASLTTWMESNDRVSEISIGDVILCGLSGIYAFASNKMHHCDIKPSNMMIGTTPHQIVLIDFGSSVMSGECLNTGTLDMSINLSSPSIGYDVTCLVVTIMHVLFKEPKRFVSEVDVRAEIAKFTHFPVMVEMLGCIPIDKDISSLSELTEIWRSVFEIAARHYEYVSSLEFMSPPAN